MLLLSLLFPFHLADIIFLKTKGVSRDEKESKNNVTSLMRVILSGTTLYQVLNRFFILREGRRDMER